LCYQQPIITREWIQTNLQKWYVDNLQIKNKHSSGYGNHSNNNGGTTSEKRLRILAALGTGDTEADDGLLDTLAFVTGNKPSYSGGGHRGRGRGGYKGKRFNPHYKRSNYNNNGGDSDEAQGYYLQL